MKKKEDTRPTKTESRKKRATLLKVLESAELLVKTTEDLLDGVASDYFGLKVGDEVVQVGGPPALFSGVVQEVQYNQRVKGMKDHAVGFVRVRPWRRGNGPRKLVSTWTKDKTFVNRDWLNLIRRPESKPKKP